MNFGNLEFEFREEQREDMDAVDLSCRCRIGLHRWSRVYRTIFSHREMQEQIDQRVHAVRQLMRECIADSLTDSVAIALINNEQSNERYFSDLVRMPIRQMPPRWTATEMEMIRTENRFGYTADAQTSGTFLNTTEQEEALKMFKIKSKITPAEEPKKEEEWRIYW